MSFGDSGPAECGPWEASGLAEGGEWFGWGIGGDMTHLGSEKFEIRHMGLRVRDG